MAMGVAPRLSFSSTEKPFSTRICTNAGVMLSSYGCRATSCSRYSGVCGLAATTEERRRLASAPQYTSTATAPTLPARTACKSALPPSPRCCSRCTGVTCGQYAESSSLVSLCSGSESSHAATPSSSRRCTVAGSSGAGLRTHGWRSGCVIFMQHRAKAVQHTAGRNPNNVLAINSHVVVVIIIIIIIRTDLRGFISSAILFFLRPRQLRLGANALQLAADELIGINVFKVVILIRRLGTSRLRPQRSELLFPFAVGQLAFCQHFLKVCLGGGQRLFRSDALFAQVVVIDGARSAGLVSTLRTGRTLFCSWSTIRPCGNEILGGESDSYTRDNGMFTEPDIEPNTVNDRESLGVVPQGEISMVRQRMQGARLPVGACIHGDGGLHLSRTGHCAYLQRCWWHLWLQEH
eukprot:m.622405 g.622405  ORF g.622405 m.622405 type:complete len:407 (+) comp22543_c0_seq22:1039-2259(+)